jgi:hypothetical protein
LIGIKPEVIQCAPANRVRVLVLRKRFAVPGYGTTGLSNLPRLAAVTLVVKRAIVCPGWMLRRRMKPDVADVNAGCQRDTKRLNASIEVLVIERIFVMVNTGRRVGHLVTHKPDAVVTRVGLDLAHRGTGPGHYGGLHSHRRSRRRK